MPKGRVLRIAFISFISLLGLVVNPGAAGRVPYNILIAITFVDQAWPAFLADSQLSLVSLSLAFA